MPRSVTEAQLQEQIVEGLRALGYIVLVTSARSVRKGYGSDHGVPDLLVTDHSYPLGMWLGLEVKRAGKGRWSHPEQERLWRLNHTAVVQSLEDAAAAIAWVESSLEAMRGLGPTIADLARSVDIDRVTREVFSLGG